MNLTPPAAAIISSAMERWFYTAPIITTDRT